MMRESGREKLKCPGFSGQNEPGNGNVIVTIRTKMVAGRSESFLPHRFRGTIDQFDDFCFVKSRACSHTTLRDAERVV
ncbi:hypothetical protein KOR42_30570 [Thalassoglobus neptunius]|uniref:Uncharacterized protein n=1 Tax=Thalassoglobus neptunius TaxID=1938619 RepID=A0A5C5WPY9_9PLAN|nr:hypothetical protein KOR42_30570 [Thalassoglobus neptunius]